MGFALPPSAALATKDPNFVADGKNRLFDSSCIRVPARSASGNLHDLARNRQVPRMQSNRPLVSDSILRYEIFVPHRSRTRVTEEFYEIACSRCLGIR
jgi:hypothetical protein